MVKTTTTDTRTVRPADVKAEIIVVLMHNVRDIWGS